MEEESESLDERLQDGRAGEARLSAEGEAGEGAV